MSELSINNFKALYGSAGTTFPDNTTQEISEADMRQFGQDIAESLLNKFDEAYSGVKGVRPGISTITNLKAIATSTLALGVIVLFRDTGNGNVLRAYELVSGTDSESSPEVIRPNDYAASTNEKIWKLAVSSSSTPYLGEVLSQGNDADNLQIKNLSDPSDPQDADTLSARTAAINAAIEGLNWKGSVKARTTGALPTNTIDGTNQILTASSNGAFASQDGVSISVNDFVLVANEADQKKNGRYRLTQAGSGGTPWILTRADDSNTGAELNNAIVGVDQGTANADTTWRQTTDNPVLGTSNIVFVAFGSVIPDASETVAGKVEEATDGETQAGTATGGTGSKLFVTPAKLATWWTWIKTQAQTFAAQITFTLAPRFSSVNASEFLKVDGSKDLISRTALQMLDDLGADLSRVASSVSSGTLTLDLASKQQRRFQVATTISSNITLALSNTTNSEAFALHIKVTGAITITMPSTFRMDADEVDRARWNTSTRVLTLTGITDSPFELVATYDGTIWSLKATRRLV